VSKQETVHLVSTVYDGIRLFWLDHGSLICHCCDAPSSPTRFKYDGALTLEIDHAERRYTRALGGGTEHLGLFRTPDCVTNICMRLEILLCPINSGVASQGQTPMGDSGPELNYVKNPSSMIL
jgi:hypothetical protein